MDQDKYIVIEQALQEGRLSEALTLLVQATKDQEKALREDAALLRSRFEHRRHQYEIKGIMTDQEFNTHYSRTMLGAQDILEKLRGGEGQSRSAGPVKPVNGLRFVILLAGLALAGLSWYLLRPEVPQETVIDKQVAPAADSPIASADSIAGEPEVEEQPAERPKTKTYRPEGPTKTEPPAATEPVPEQGKLKEETPAMPPAPNYEVQLVRNSNMSDAEVFVDGEPAILLNRTPIIVTVQVQKKAGMHRFELRKDGKSCAREQLINQDKVRIVFNCK